MDYIKGFFGMSSPNSANTKSAPTLKTFGPQTVNGKDGEFWIVAGVYDPSPPSNKSAENGSLVEFYLWSSGSQSRFMYRGKSPKDDKPLRIYTHLSRGEFTLEDRSPPRHFIVNMTAGTQKGQAKSETIKEEFVLTQLDDALQISTRFPDVTHAYFARLNKLLVSIEHDVKQNDNFREDIHRKIWSILVEAKNLTYHIAQSKILDAHKKDMRFKQLNEWVTRFVLVMDGLTVPCDQHGEPDPLMRSQRKSLINFSLYIGSELNLLIDGCSFEKSRNEAELKLVKDISHPKNKNVIEDIARYTEEQQRKKQSAQESPSLERDDQNQPTPNIVNIPINFHQSSTSSQPASQTNIPIRDHTNRK